METKLFQGNPIRGGITEELACELGSLGLNVLYQMEVIGVRKEDRHIPSKGTYDTITELA